MSSGNLKVQFWSLISKCHRTFKRNGGNTAMLHAPFHGHQHMKGKHIMLQATDIFGDNEQMLSSILPSKSSTENS
jgi:hypothetical protein